MIGKMDRRPIFYNEAYTQDLGGGNSAVEVDRWQQWAQVDDRTGSSFLSQSQTLELYDYKVRVRFDGRFSSNTWMIYEGQVCVCKSMTIDTEGYKHFLILRYAKTDTWVDLS